MDDEILKRVESILGKNVKIVDCEKTSSIREEEILLINGIPVPLEGEDGLAIKKALISGQVPSCKLLNQLLYQAGILQKPVQLESTVSVKSSLVTKEDIIVAKDGKILDERCHETCEKQYYSTLCDEVWQSLSKTNNTLPDRLNEQLKLDVSTLKNNNSLIGSNKNAIIPSKNSNTSNQENSTDQQFINEIPFKNIIREQVDSVITSKSITETYRVPIDRNILSAMSNNSGNTLKKSTIASITSKPKVELFSSSVSTLSANTDDSIQHDPLTNESNCTNQNLLSKLTCLFENTEQTPINAQTNIQKTNILLENPLSVNSLSQLKTKISDDKNSKIIESNENIKENLIDNIIIDPNYDVYINHINSYSNNKKEISRKINTINDGSSNKNNHEKTLNNKVTDKETINTSLTSSSSSSSSNVCDSLHITNKINSRSQNIQVANDFIANKLISSSNCEYNNKSTDEIDCHPSNNLHIFHSNKTNDFTLDLKNLKNINTENIQSNDQKQYGKKTTTIIDENFLVYRDGLLISGPLDSLIKHMVPTSNYFPDSSFLFAFLLSARLFINPNELFEKVCHLGENQLNIIAKSQNFIADTLSATSIVQNLNPNTTSNQEAKQDMVQKTYAKQFLCLLSEWVRLFPYDFRDERLMQQVRLMQQKCLSIDVNLRQEVSMILQNLLEKLTVLEKYENFLQSVASSDSVDCSNLNSVNITTNNEKEEKISSSTNFSTNITTSISSSSSLFHQHITGLIPSYTNHSISSGSIGSVANINCVEIIEICPSSTLLSQQLTHIELEKLSHIGPEEFVQVFSKENVNIIDQNKRADDASSTKEIAGKITDAKKTRNLETYVHWFNRFSYLVATEIVKYPKKKQRVRVVEYWIETARECFNIGNFNSLMAIIAGLNMSPIARLRKTWAKVQTAKFSVLEHQMDPSSNFNSYRSTLKAAMWRSAGATNEREKIIIPFFSLLVKDLYFLNEGCSNRLANGHINFEKFWQVSKQIKEFISWKEVMCPFEKDNKTIMFLQTNSVLNENTLSIASFECEPPENHQEKERFKGLKSEISQSSTGGINNASHQIIPA